MRVNVCKCESRIYYLLKTKARSRTHTHTPTHKVESNVLQLFGMQFISGSALQIIIPILQIHKKVRAVANIQKN